MHFQRLASAFIEQKQPGTGRPILSVPARAYGAFRHGFAAGFPLHSPKGAILHDDVGRFPSEEAFLAYQQRVHLMAEILYLGDLETDGSRRVERVSPIVYSSQLKPLVQITYLAAKWTYEPAKYAHSLFGSVDLRFPYLVSTVDVLGPERRAILQTRLDALEGRV